MKSLCLAKPFREKWLCRKCDAPDASGVGGVGLVRLSSGPLRFGCVCLLDQFLHQLIGFHSPSLADIDKHLEVDITDPYLLCHLNLRSGSGLIADGGYRTL